MGSRDRPSRGSTWRSSWSATARSTRPWCPSRATSAANNALEGLLPRWSFLFAVFFLLLLLLLTVRGHLTKRMVRYEFFLLWSCLSLRHTNRCHWTLVNKCSVLVQYFCSIVQFKLAMKVEIKNWCCCCCCVVVVVVVVCRQSTFFNSHISLWAQCYRCPKKKVFSFIYRESSCMFGPSWPPPLPHLYTWPFGLTLNDICFISRVTQLL